MRIRHMITFSAVVAVLLFAALLPAFGADAADPETDSATVACCADVESIE